MGFDELDKEILENKYAMIESYLTKIKTGRSLEEIEDFAETAKKIANSLLNSDEYKVALLGNIRTAVRRKKQELLESKRRGEDEK